MNDATGAPVRAERTVKRTRGLKVIVTGVKRNDAHDCFDKATIRYESKLPEVVAAPGIKPPGLTRRRKGGTGEPVPVECNLIGKDACRCARAYEQLQSARH